MIYNFTIGSLITGTKEAIKMSACYYVKKVTTTVYPMVLSPKQTTKSIYGYCAGRSSGFLNKLISNFNEANVRRFLKNCGNGLKDSMYLFRSVSACCLMICKYIMLSELLICGDVSSALNRLADWLTLENVLYGMACCVIVVFTLRTLCIPLLNFKLKN